MCDSKKKIDKKKTQIDKENKENKENKTKSEIVCNGDVCYIIKK